jgi:hypothetical protein
MDFSSIDLAREIYESKHNFTRDTLDNIIGSTFHYIRSGQLNLGRHCYSGALGYGVRQALHCGYEKIIAIEFGVGEGNGLLDLCKAAQYYRNLFNIDIQVYGFDLGNGLPPAVDYRDHPEIWTKNQFRLPDHETFKSQLPDFCHLVLGDVKDTIPAFKEQLGDEKICFVSLDLDYYSSTKSALEIFNMRGDAFVPAVAMYVDDVFGNITYNPWCGAEGAINDYNSSQDLRKIHYRNNFNFMKFYTCHIFDHPVRTGKQTPLIRFELQPL